MEVISRDDYAFLLQIATAGDTRLNHIFDDADGAYGRLHDLFNLVGLDWANYLGTWPEHAAMVLERVTPEGNDDTAPQP